MKYFKWSKKSSFASFLSLLDKIDCCEMAKLSKVQRCLRRPFEIFYLILYDYISLDILINTFRNFQKKNRPKSRRYSVTLSEVI